MMRSQLKYITSQTVSVNNVLREYNEMKEEIKNTETSVEYKYGKYKQKNVCKK